MATSSEQRAIALLGAGVIPSAVAKAVGISDSRISQLLADPEIAKQVAEARFNSLLEETERDKKYDNLEDALLAKCEKLLPYMNRPMEVFRALIEVNKAKRRGASAPESLTESTRPVQITIPVVVSTKFMVSANNQVIQAGEQPLVTIQAAQLDRMLENVREQPSTSEEAFGFR